MNPSSSSPAPRGSPGSPRSSAARAGENPGRARRESAPWVLAAVCLGALLVKVWLCSTTRGTNDVATYLRFLHQWREWGAVRLYAEDPDFNHPPFVLRLLAWIDAITRATGLSWSFWLRMPAILADLGSVLVLRRILASALPEEAAARRSLYLAAAAPISILVSGFHGNNDAVMVLFTLLALHWAAQPGWAALAGAAMGMAVNVKVVPLMFWPAFLFWLPGWRRRAAFFGTAILVVVLGSSPVLFEAPAVVARKVLGYPSVYGCWGLSRLTSWLPWPLTAVSELLRLTGRWALAGAILWLAVRVNRGTRKPALFLQLGAIAFLFMTFTTGFSVQYLVWLVPFLAGLPIRLSGAFLAVSGSFLVLVYTYWRQAGAGQPLTTNWLETEFWRRGLPWDYADSAAAKLWRGGLVPVEIACWLTVAWGCSARLRQLLRGGELNPSATGPSRAIP